MSEFYLPLILLALSFFIKLSVSREIKKPNIITAIAELPVDIMFIGSAFIITYIKLYSNKILETFTTKGIDQIENFNLNPGINCFVSYILLTIVVTAIWRTSEKFFIDQKWVYFYLCLIVSYIISCGAIFYSISLLNEVIK